MLFIYLFFLHVNRHCYRLVDPSASSCCSVKSLILVRLARVLHIKRLVKISKMGVFFIYLFGERGMAATSEVSGVLSRQDKRITIMAEMIVFL